MHIYKNIIVYFIELDLLYVHVPKESSILHRNNILKSIKNRTSFSFTENSIGKRYYFKLFLLFSALFILTLYGKQGDTLNFTPTQKFSILIDQQKPILLFKHKSQKKPQYSVFFPKVITTFCHPKFPQNSVWHLISLSVNLDTTCLKSTPVSWTVKNLLPYIPYPGWPTPSNLLSVNYSNGIKYSLKSLSSSNNAQLFIIDSISFMFITDTTNIENAMLLKHTEKIDVLIITNAATERSNYFRTTLRPLFCITTADPGNEGTIQNYVYMDKECSALEIAIDNNKRIKSVQKACK